MDLKGLIFIIAITSAIHIVQSANILGYLITNIRSHFNVADVLMRTLADNGHNVNIRHSNYILN